MGPNTLALTCLSLLLAQAPNDVIFMKTRSFNLPFGIAPADRVKLRAVRLYVSRDQGRSWNKEMQIRPDETRFPFFAEKDGEYWFRTTIVDRNNQEWPKDVERGKYSQKVVVDTLPPRIEITSAKREGEYVVVDWKLLERHTDWNTLELQYKPYGPYADARWQPVPKFPQQAQGTMRFRPNMAQAVLLRLQVVDRAKNRSFSEKIVAGIDGTVNQVSHKPEAPRGQTRGVPDVAPPMRKVGNAGHPAFREPDPPVPLENKKLNNEPMLPPEPKNAQPKINKREDFSITSDGTSKDIVSGSAPSGKKETSQNGGALMTTPQKQLPPIRYINTPELVLRFEISKIG